jgi:hypothetical protein
METGMESTLQFHMAILLQSYKTYPEFSLEKSISNGIPYSFPCSFPYSMPLSKLYIAWRRGMDVEME